MRLSGFFIFFVLLGPTNPGANHKSQRNCKSRRLINGYRTKS